MVDAVLYMYVQIVHHVDPKYAYVDQRLKVGATVPYSAVPLQALILKLIKLHYLSFSFIKSKFLVKTANKVTNKMPNFGLKS